MDKERGSNGDFTEECREKVGGYRCQGMVVAVPGQAAEPAPLHCNRHADKQAPCHVGSFPAPMPQAQRQLALYLADCRRWRCGSAC